VRSLAGRELLLESESGLQAERFSIATTTIFVGLPDISNGHYANEWRLALS
jgi:hypothetical protein